MAAIKGSAASARPQQVKEPPEEQQPQQRRQQEYEFQMGAADQQSLIRFLMNKAAKAHEEAESYHNAALLIAAKTAPSEESIKIEECGSEGRDISDCEGRDIEQDTVFHFLYYFLFL